MMDWKNKKKRQSTKKTNKTKKKKQNPFSENKKTGVKKGETTKLLPHYYNTNYKKIKTPTQ